MFQRKKVIILICLVWLILSSCKDSNVADESIQNEILLCDLSLPKEYELIFKDKYYPEGEVSNENDSIYMFKKDDSKIEITIKYFNKKKSENIDDRINSLTEELYSDNNSFTVKYKKKQVCGFSNIHSE